MPKLKNLPKRPKQSASYETWKRYEEKCNEVKKYNKDMQAREKKKKDLIKKRHTKI